MAAAMHPMEEEPSFSTLFLARSRLPNARKFLSILSSHAIFSRSPSNVSSFTDSVSGGSESPTAEEEIEKEAAKGMTRRDSPIRSAGLATSKKLYLAGELGLDPKQVAVWFQNRRARLKSKKLEEEYVCLRSSLDATIVEKCRLENEVLKLKEKLAQSEEEIKRLTSASGGGGAAGSPSSSLTTTGYGELRFPSLMEDFCYLYDFRM
ncbi:hypothetical protein HPP92_024599 [Vanilla planifolia]|uniref:Homeobox-leucine zipper protein n=1 Tax=Vanilla planifolia TaxID=51239 RepID=A0A835PR17_VANPL|nr:hypothetical protein HPP92_024599 [Vanilla planifolia]